jgi:hypothetical protein
MNTAIIAATTSGPLSSTIILVAARLRRVVSERREALECRLQEFGLELLAAIVLIATFMVVTEPAAREDP